MRVITATASHAAWEDAVLAASAGVSYRAEVEGDPVAAWLDLMEVVEALCPQWPVRNPIVGRDYRL